MAHIKENPIESSANTDARMLRTRKALREALLSLIARKQFHEITVRDIAAEAGIGYATFFRHHASKEELLNEIAAEQIGQLMSLTLPLLQATDTRSTCLALANYVYEHRAVWAALLTGGAGGAMRQELTRLAMLGASRIQTEGWLPVELGTVFGVTATVEILAWWLRKPEQMSPEKVAEILDRLVVAPAVGDASRISQNADSKKARR